MILSIGSSVPGNGLFAAFASKQQFCEMVVFTTGLKVWVEKSSFSVASFARIVCVCTVGDVVSGVRVCLTNVVLIDFAGPVYIVLSLVFLPFEWFR